jgi:hypothetical protein
MVVGWDVCDGRWWVGTYHLAAEVVEELHVLRRVHLDNLQTERTEGSGG